MSSISCSWKHSAVLNRNRIISVPDASLFFHKIALLRKENMSNRK